MDNAINFNEELGPEFTIAVIQYTSGVNSGVLPSPPFEVVMRRPVSHMFVLTVGTRTHGYTVSSNTDSDELSPQLTWDTGLVTRVDYSGGGYKLLTYLTGRLIQSLFYRTGKPTIRKTVTYNLDNTVDNVLQDTI